MHALTNMTELTLACMGGISLKKPLRFMKTIDLLKEYQKQSTIYETLKETLRNLTAGSDIQTRIKTEKELRQKQVDILKLMIEFIKRYSPISGKNMEYKLKRVHDTNKEWLEKMEKADELSDSLRLQIATSSGPDILEQWVTHMFVSIVDTLKTAKLPFLLQKNEFLEIKLNQLDSKYLRLYQAAWLSLDSQNPDSCRQCASSLRQLLLEIIKKGTGKDRETKIRSLLEFDDPKFETAAFLLVNSTLSLLSKAVHKEMDSKQMSYAMMLTEDSLMLLIRDIER